MRQTSMHLQDPDKKKLLVTGASGVLGWTLCTIAARTFQTFGTVFQHHLAPPGVRLCPVDLTDERSVADLFASIRPDAVIHTAALSSPDYCQVNPTESEAINIVASRHIASLCAEDGIPCVYTSSDLVFDGEHAPYDEASPANPVSIYGEHKLRAEKVMRTRYPETTICRLPLMFGSSSPARHDFFVGMLRSMKAGKEVPLFVDEIRTPVSTATASHGLILALQRSPGTTIHLGGAESVSRWELGRLAAEIFTVGKQYLVPCRQKDVKLRAPRPRDVSLNSMRSREIGYLPKTIREQMCHLNT